MLETIFYVGALGLTFFSGVGLGKSYAKPAPSSGPPPLRPCSCTHGYGYHDDKDGCHALDPRYVNNKTGSLSECRCLRYDGEIPLEQWGRLT